MKKYSMVLELLSVCVVACGVISYITGNVETAIYEISLGIYSMLVASYEWKA